MTTEEKYETALEYYRGADYGKAFPLMKEAADAGIAEAQFYMGEMYSMGHGCERSADLALDYYDLARHNGIEAAGEVSQEVFCEGYKIVRKDLEKKLGKIFDSLFMAEGERNPETAKYEDDAGEPEWGPDDCEYLIEDKIDRFIEKNGFGSRIEERLPVLTVVYAACHGIDLDFDERGRISLPLFSDLIFKMLYEATLHTHVNYAFEDVADLYKTLVSDFDKDVLADNYPGVIKQLIDYSDPYRTSTDNPSMDIVDTVKNYLDSHGCRSIYVPYCGVGINVFSLGKKRTMLAQDKSGINCIMASLIMASGSAAFPTIRNSDPLVNWPEQKFDSIVCFRTYDEGHVPAHEWAELFNRIERTTQKCAAVLVSFQFCSSLDKGMHRDVLDTRRHLCEIGALDRIVEFSGTDFFTDESRRTALVFLDFANGHDSVTFYDLSDDNGLSFLENRDITSFVSDADRHTVSYEELMEQDYSWVSAVYIQNIRLLPGQKAVRLGDILTVDDGLDREGDDYYVVLDDYFSHDLLRALNVPRRDFVKEIPEYDPSRMYKGEHIFMKFDGQVRLFAVKNDDSFCYFGDMVAFTVNTDIVDIEYLASALLADRSLEEFFSVFHNQGGGMFIRYLLNRRIAIYTDRDRQVVELERAIGASLAAVRSRQDYNVIWAVPQDSAMSLLETRMTNRGIIPAVRAECYKGDYGLSSALSEQIARVQQPDRKIHAVILDAALPINDTNSGNYKGLRRAVGDFINLRKDGRAVPLFILFDESPDLLKEALEEYEDEEIAFLFDGRHVVSPDDYETLIGNVRDELDGMYSCEGNFKKQYFEEFSASEWMDSQWQRDKAGHLYSFSMVSTVARMLGVPQEDKGADISFDSVRNCVHRMLDLLQQLNLVPGMIDYGAVPHLLQNRCYDDNDRSRRYLQCEQIMPEALPMSLSYFISLCNSGVHGMVVGKNLMSALVGIVLEFLLWTYDAVVAGHLDGRQRGNFFWRELRPCQFSTTEPYKVEYITEGKNQYWYCRGPESLAVHLLAPKEGFEDGASIRFTKPELNMEKKPRFHDGLAVVYFAKRDEYKIV